MEEFLFFLKAFFILIGLPVVTFGLILYFFIKIIRNRQKICPNCKLRIHKEANICHHCHSKLD